jgi:O-antigen/teichoic acid export membrane protein
LKPFDENGSFRAVVESDGMRRHAVRSAGVTVFAQGLGFAVQMIATVALARLLTPADFGVVTMVTTFSLLLVSCGQIGFPEAVLQKDKIDHFLASNLFWINLAAGLFLTLAFAAAGSLIAKFYGDPRVAHVAIGVSLTIVITSTSILHLALLKRAMRFSAVSANDIVARSVSVGVSILLAWAGWGYWALVAGAVAQPLSTSIGAWILCQWIPSLPRRRPETGSMVKFAVHVYGRFSLDYITRNTDNLLVGWRFGSISLGFYKKAYDLFALSSNQLLSVFPVAVSTLSRLTHDRAQYRRYFVGGLTVLALIGMGAGAELTLVGRDLVRLVLGAKWEASGQMLTYFGPGIGIMLIYGTHGMIHLSIGTPARWLRWGFIEFAVTCLLFLLALRWGPAGIAVAWTASFWILIVPAFWYAGRPIGFGIAPVLAAVWKYMAASLLAGLACSAILRRIPALVAASGPVGAITRILTTSVVFVVLYLAAIVLLHGGLAPLKQFARLLKDMGPRGQSSAPTIGVAAEFNNVPLAVAKEAATVETA